jgi:ergothioneine biosynthesis protein EgtB
MTTLASPVSGDAITAVAAQFAAVRRQSLALCESLTAEDMMVQSLPEASPAKWHLAHTTWFFETFILREFASGYQPFHPDFLWLFNSYYNGISDQPGKKLRASFSRPAFVDIVAYRRHVEDAIASMLNQEPPQEALTRLVLGLHHEQQHQELLLTDIKHALWTNPLRPVYREGNLGTHAQAAPPVWHEYEGGLREAGYQGEEFSFDNERPRHSLYLQPFRIVSRPVTCGEYLEFIEDGGYRRSELWLSAGWDAVREHGWQAPLYWQHEDGAWQIFTLHGSANFSTLRDTAVCHISHFEADAYARWRGLRLPTEFEWELAASPVPTQGNLLESGRLHPAVAPQSLGEAQDRQPLQLYGDVWEWTASAYLGYPGYRPVPGALGEYNGKFMSGQMVLRGGSCATPASHIRATYRNFFAPSTRWQFSGVRLAKDVS